MGTVLIHIMQSLNTMVRGWSSSMVSQIMMQKMISLLSIPTQDVKGILVFKDYSCQGFVSETLFKSLLIWLAVEVSWLAVEVLSPCQ